MKKDFKLFLYRRLLDLGLCMMFSGVIYADASVNAETTAAEKDYAGQYDAKKQYAAASISQAGESAHQRVTAVEGASWPGLAVAFGGFALAVGSGLAGLKVINEEAAGKNAALKISAFRAP